MSSVRDVFVLTNTYHWRRAPPCGLIYFCIPGGFANFQTYPIVGRISYIVFRLYQEISHRTYLVGGLEHFFPIYWECHHPNWRTPSFFRGIETTNQDNMNIYDISDQWQPGDIRALSYKKCSTKRSPRYVPRNCSAGTGPLRRLPWSLTRLPEYEGPRSW